MNGDETNPGSTFWRRRLRRRTLLGRVALGSASVVALAAAGCTSSSQKQPAGTSGAAAGTSSIAAAGGSPAAKQPKRGGAITHLSSSESSGDNLDPDTNTGIKGLGERLIYQALLGYDLASFKIEPETAQKWEQPDPATFLFHLQPGIKWHNKAPANGRLLNANDVIFSLNRVHNGEPQYIGRSLLQRVDKLEAPDAGTLRLTTGQPEAGMLSYLSADTLLLLAPEVVDKAGKFATADSAVGTGPFVITSVADKVGSDYVRNPDYWKPGRPYLDAFHCRYFDDGLPSGPGAWAAFLAKQLDQAEVPGSEVKGFLAQQPKDYQPLWYPDTGWGSMATPNVQVKPFDDPRVTRALRLLIDHDEFVSAWAGGNYGRGGLTPFLQAGLADQDLPESALRQNLEFKQPKDDAVKEALSLLGAAGFSKANPLKNFEIAVTASEQYQSAAVLLQAQWRRLGQGAVDAGIKVLDTPAYQAVRASRSFSYGMFSGQPSFNEVGVTLVESYRTGGGRNYANFSDPQFDALVDKQRATLDPAQRKAVVNDALLYLLDHSPGVIGSARDFLNAIKPNIRDFEPEFALAGRQYEWVWLDT